MVWREAQHVLENVLHQKKKRKLAKDDIARIGEVGEGEKTWVLLFSEVSSEHGFLATIKKIQYISSSIFLYFILSNKKSSQFLTIGGDKV